VTQSDVLIFAVYCVLILLASLAGGWVPMLVPLTHRRMQVATSAIAGFMLGVGLLHLLPHAMPSLTPLATGVWVLVGVLTMFLLERVFSYHHHTAPAAGDALPVSADPELAVECDEPGDPIDHHHGHTHDHAHGHSHADHRRLSWVGITVGLVLHSMIAGAALAAVMLAEAGMGHADHTDQAAGDGGWAGWALLPGLGVFIAILLHKPFDSMTLLTLLRTTGWSRTTQHIINGLFGLAVPLGGVLFFLGVTGLTSHDSSVVAAAVAVSAGVFLCVALADLLPEVHFHTHDRGLLTLALAAGLALAGTITWLETNTHAHDHGHGHGQEQHDTHDHDTHAPNNTDPHAGHDHSSHDHGTNEPEPTGPGNFFQQLP